MYNVISKLPRHRIVLFGILVMLTGFGFWSEKIPVNNHTGWDGKHYANLTIHFEEMAVQHQIDAYQYQRILTPVIIFYTAKLAGIPLHPDNIVQAFFIYNLILILICALLFFKLSSTLKLTAATEITGFSCLFFNYCVLKNTAYYPVLTDTTALFFGFLLGYFFIRQYNRLLFMTVLLGQFCYPMLLVVSTPLALNLRSNTITQKLQRFSFFKVSTLLIILLLLIGYYQVLYVPDIIIPKYKMELNSWLLPLSVACVLVYIWKGITAFAEKLPQQDDKINFIPLLLKLTALLAFVILTGQFISTISIPEEVFTPIVFIRNVLQQSIDNPLVYWVAHCIYLGPALILLVFLYKPVIQTVTQYGDSAIFYFILILLFSIGSETRQFIHFYPFVMIMLMVTLNRYHISAQSAGLFAAFSVVTSKIWWPINTPDSFTQYLYAQFPDQYYFMNHGPFMSDLSYFINTGIVIIELVIVWLLILKRKDERVIAG